MNQVVRVISNTHLDIPFGIQQVSMQYCDDDYSLKMQDAPHYLFEYVIEGECTIEFEGQTYVAEPGSAYMLPTGSDYTIRALTPPFVKIGFQFYGDLVRDLLLNYGLSFQVLFPEVENRVGDLFHRILSLGTELHQPMEISLKVSLLFHEIVIELYKQCNSTNFAHKSGMQRVRSFITANATDLLSMEALCERFHLSRSCLFRRYKAVYGMTPYDYYLNRRVKLSKSFLNHSTLSISDISNRMHFTDQHHFSNWFKKNTGISPLQYRNMEFFIEEGTGTLTTYAGQSSTVILPPEVKAIGNHAFKGNTRIEKIIIRQPLDYIGWESFRYCSFLKEVVFEGAGCAREIRSEAFSNCLSLRKVVFPNGLESVFGWVFNGAGTQYAEFPSTVQKFQLGSLSFAEQCNIERFVILADHAEFDPHLFNGCNYMHIPIYLHKDSETEKNLRNVEDAAEYADIRYI